MEANFWISRWESNQIGFHTDEINPSLTRFWPQLNLPKGEVFVPLCGKSNDLQFLARQEHQVLGVELSETAVHSFFKENSLSYKTEQGGDFSVLKNDSIRLFCGDFFKITSDQIKNTVAIYDRASLIALPPEMREQYAQHLIKISPKNIKILLVTLETTEEDKKGPPFSVSEDEVKKLYQSNFAIEKIHEEDVLEQNERFKSRGIPHLFEKTYILTKK
ncbi:MAG: thiopurine S-methyltransferase [bacterium]|jgi:thiopurine S-methyltransferase